MLTDIVRARNIFAIFSAPNLCRAYPWGVAEVERLDHNDFPLLKEHLFRIDSIRDMIESTTRRSELLFKREKEKEKERMETLESIEEIEKNEIDRKKEEEELIELENQRRIEEEIERRVMEIKEELEQERDEEQRTLEEKIKLRIEEEVQYRLKTTSNSTLRQYSSIAWKDVSLFLLTIHFLYSCYHQRALSSYLGELD